MLLKAANDFDLDLAECILIGDSPSDIEAGKRAGCQQTFQVASGVSLLDVVKTLQKV